MHYYRGESRARTVQKIHERYGLRVPERTLSAWLAENRALTTYARLRADGARLYSPYRLIRSVRLHHQQVYEYRIHNGKLATILGSPQHERFRSVSAYLNEMVRACPNHLFNAEARASQGKTAFDLNGVEIKSLRNHACRVADLVLQSVVHHKRRHEELQRFMLTTDSVTVAIEVPVFLTPDDITYFRNECRFDVPIESSIPLTGHIDVLQIRNGSVHILDYKPGAKGDKPIAQLMVYALALSRRMNLKLFDFVCAWFDEHHYYEFYPLCVVRKRT
jgi:ATP-dependent exoDNAse (exonuclease V) beta subunit